MNCENPAEICATSRRCLFGNLESFKNTICPEIQKNIGIEIWKSRGISRTIEGQMDVFARCGMRTASAVHRTWLKSNSHDEEAMSSNSHV